MSNERSSIFETFTVQGEAYDNQTLEQFFQDNQVISTPQFYTQQSQQQQQNPTYLIQSPVPQQQFIQQDQFHSHNPYHNQVQQQTQLHQQYIPQQKVHAFSGQQQANLIQQQLNQQKQLYQQKRQQQQQQTNLNQIINTNENQIIYIKSDDNPSNNTLFVSDNNNYNNNGQILENDIFSNNSSTNNSYLINNHNNPKTTIINEQFSDGVVSQDNNNTINNNYYENSCNDFTGVEEVVEELWMSCESHESPIFNDGAATTNDQVYEFVDPNELLAEADVDDLISSKEKMKKKKKKKLLPTCYSLFYRDTQLAIKEQRPDASVHEVTSIVDSMWKQLEPKHRAYYEKLAKIEKSKYKRLLKKEAGKLERGKDGKTGTGTSKKIKQAKQQDEKAVGHVVCRREGCTLRAIDDVRWSKDYCSTQCVVNHCKDVFKAWVIARKEELENSEKKE